MSQHQFEESLPVSLTDAELLEHGAEAAMEGEDLQGSLDLPPGPEAA